MHYELFVVHLTFVVKFIVKGDVSGSLVEFDKAMQLDPRQKACRFIHFWKTIHEFTLIFRL